MNLSDQIQIDFKELIDFLTAKKISTKLRFHHKRAAVVGALLFLADVANNNGMQALFDRLIEQAKLAKNSVGEQFKTNWLHNMRDVSKMDMAYLCDISEGYNSARTHYGPKYSVNLPDEMPIGTCGKTIKPVVKKAINKLIEKLSEE